jgi:CheY-like chemotaxis protein
MSSDEFFGACVEGRTVLLVEDESLVSMLAEDVLENAGCEVLLAMRLGEALELANTADLDFAILDVNLGGGDTSYPVAQLLEEKEIPFFFASGYSAAGVDQRFQHCCRIQKPYTADSLLRAAAALCAVPRPSRSHH